MRLEWWETIQILRDLVNYVNWTNYLKIMVGQQIKAGNWQDPIGMLKHCLVTELSDMMHVIKILSLWLCYIDDRAFLGAFLWAVEWGWMHRYETYVGVRNDKMNFRGGPPFSAVFACCLQWVSVSFQMAISYAFSHHLSIYYLLSQMFPTPTPRTAWNHLALCSHNTLCPSAEVALTCIVIICSGDCVAVVDRIMVPQRCPYPIPWNLWICYLINLKNPDAL